MKKIIESFRTGHLRIIAGFVVLLLINTSCRKEADFSPVQAGVTKDLKAPTDFNWNTTKEVTIKVIGMKEVNPEIANTLYVNSVNGVVFYKDLLAMNLNYSFTVTIPVTETNLVLVYGSKTKTFDLTTETAITFDYITE